MKRSRKLLGSLLLLIGLGTSGCLGPDNLYNSIKNWNADLSDQDWVTEVVFLGLYIVPVYQIAALADVLFFNTYAYWSGDPLVKDAGTFPGFRRDD